MTIMMVYNQSTSSVAKWPGHGGTWRYGGSKSAVGRRGRFEAYMELGAHLAGI
jgi:hypothetical protein